MKKILLALTISLILTGCSTKKEDETVLTSEDEVTTETAQVGEEQTSAEEQDEVQSSEENEEQVEVSDEVESNSSEEDKTATTTKPVESKPTNTTTSQTKPNTSNSGSTTTTQTNPNNSNSGSTSTTQSKPNTSTQNTVETKPKDTVTTKTVTVNEAIAFKVEEVKDSSLEQGKRVVTRAGVKGTKVKEYLVTYTNGVETSRKYVSEKITKQPVSEIVSVGTKVSKVDRYEEITVRKEVIKYTTEYVNDPTLNKGVNMLRTEGSNGQKEVTIKTVYENGVEVSSTVVSEKITKQVVNKVIAVGTKTPTPTEDLTASKKAFELINDYRESQGLNRLKWSDEIYKLSVIRAKEATQKFSHERPDGTMYYTVGNVSYENLGAGQSTPEAIVKAWKESPGHNSVMLLSNAKESAVAVVRIQGVGYGVYWAYLGR